MTDQFIREIQEDLRRDKALKLWKRYGLYLIGALVAIVAIVAAVVGWREYQAAQRAEEGRRFAQAAQMVEQGQQAQAANAFAALGEDAGGGYADLARLRQAEALLAGGDRDGAVATLEALAGDGGADERLAAIARLKGAMLLIDNASVADIQGRLQPLITSGGPWRPLAEEMIALARLKAGETEEAGRALARLAEDAQAPRGVRRRASELAALLGVEPRPGAESKSETVGGGEQ